MHVLVHNRKICVQDAYFPLSFLASSVFCDWDKNIHVVKQWFRENRTLTLPPPNQPCLINSLPIVQTKGEGVKGFFKKIVELVKSVSLIHQRIIAIPYLIVLLTKCDSEKRIDVLWWAFKAGISCPFIILLLRDQLSFRVREYLSKCFAWWKSLFSTAGALVVVPV